MRGNGRIFRRGDVWWCAYCRNGKEYRESSGKRGKKGETAARKLLKKRLREVDGGEFVEPANRKVTLDELLDDLVRDYKLNGRDWKKLTYKIKPLRAALGYHRAGDITEQMIERYKEERLAEARPCPRCKGRDDDCDRCDGDGEVRPAPATVNRELAALRRSLRRAYDQRLLSRVPKVEQLREDNVREGFVELQDFEAVAEHLPPEIRDVAEFAFLAGWRKGEVLRFTWEFVEFGPDGKPEAIRLQRAHAKNRRARRLPVSGRLAALMERRAEARKVEHPDGTVRLADHVFHRQGEPIRDFRGTWQAATEKAGRRGLFFHDLRRSAVRNLIRAGVPEKVAMEVSGHRTRAILERYNIVDDSDLREAVERTDRYLEERAEGKVRKLQG